jgi:pimeloyl-ACP methyl ester carboxylesterase
MEAMPERQSTSRFQHGTVNLTVPIHYVELPGDGPPAMLLHGIGMDWRVWQATSRRLSPYFHLYMVDLRGHGGSGKPAHGYTLAHYAADIEDAIDALGLSGVTVIGSSLGAAVTVAVEAPADLVAARVLVDPPLSGGPVRDPANFERILALKHEAPAALANHLAPQYPGSSAFLLTTMAEMWHEAADGVIEDLLAQRETYFGLDAALQAVESPTLILQADRAMGGVLTDRQARRALDLLPHGTLVHIPGAGHAIHGTKPVDFARHVVEFARRLSLIS